MTHAGRNIDFLVRAMDRAFGTRVKDLARDTTFVITAAAFVLVGVLGLVLSPIRDTVGPENVALVLAIIVGLVGSSAGPVPGLVLGGWAALVFALLHSVPLGLPALESEQDAVTAGLLLVSGWVGGMISRRLTAASQRADVYADDLDRLSRVGDVAAHTRDRADVVNAAIEEISGELRLKDAHLEEGPPDKSWHELGRNGLIDGLATDELDDDLPLLLAEGVAIELGPSSRLVLMGDPEVDVNPRQLRVVTALADYIIAMTRVRP